MKEIAVIFILCGTVCILTLGRRSEKATKESTECQTVATVSIFSAIASTYAAVTSRKANNNSKRKDS